LLAGRKLLLADDSITIQKVVELTFADEGVSVVCVDNGREALEKLGEFIPDIVLADVFMPEVTGYEVCEYIKRSDKLKHIPVMLLVGSFEPFDEGEARRVGANDTLTKPFQSIRRLIDKVGMLVSGRSPEEQIPTAELPKPEGAPEPEVEKLTTAELEISTADTKPLPPELTHVVEGASSQATSQATSQAMAQEAESMGDTEGEPLVAETQFDQGMMENRVVDPWGEVVKPQESAGEVLLDLGDFQTDFQGGSSLGEDFVLDIDLDEAPETSPEPAFASPSYYGGSQFSSSPGAPSAAATITAELPALTADQMAATQEFHHELREAGDTSMESSPTAMFSEVEVVEAPLADSGASAVEVMPVAEVSTTGAAVSAAEVSPQQLSPEMIDAIARRVVEHMSEKVVQEIAWEVVPQLAELLIKRQLEEKNS
jgi:CheY-like chemotaxis protein